MLSLISNLGRQVLRFFQCRLLSPRFTFVEILLASFSGDFSLCSWISDFVVVVVVVVVVVLFVCSLLRPGKANAPKEISKSNVSRALNPPVSE